MRNSDRCRRLMWCHHFPFSYQDRRCAACPFTSVERGGGWGGGKRPRESERTHTRHPRAAPAGPHQCGTWPKVELIFLFFLTRFGQDRPLFICLLQYKESIYCLFDCHIFGPPRTTVQELNVNRIVRNLEPCACCLPKLSSGLGVS